MAKQININSLEAGTIIKVRGQVAYSRIRSQIAGEELRRQNDRDRQAGRPITESAHTKLDLKNCQVLCNDPNNMSLAEKFILERLYTSQKHPENGYCYRAMNKGKYLPQICFRAADNPNVMQQFELTLTTDRASTTYALRSLSGSIRPMGQTPLRQQASS